MEGSSGVAEPTSSALLRWETIDGGQVEASSIPVEAAASHFDVGSLAYTSSKKVSYVSEQCDS